MPLLVSWTVLYQMERMQKEVSVGYLRYYPGVWLERRRKTSKSLGQDS
jgi:hypothetical protein